MSFSTRTRTLLSPLVMFTCTLMAVWLSLGVIGRPNQLLYVWALTGLQLGMLLPCWRRDWLMVLSCQAAGALGIVLGATISGVPLGISIMIGLINACDVTLAGWIMSPAMATFEDLKDRTRVLRLGVAALVSPLMMGSIAAFAVVAVTHQPFLRVATASVLSDSVGMAVFLPLVLYFRSGEYRTLARLRPFLRHGIPAGVLFTAVTCYVFWQSRNPLLSLLFPPMMLMVLAMGLEGAVFTTSVLTIVGGLATHLHHGPIWLMVDASPAHRLVLLQMYLLVSAATALPVGALLDERRRVQRSATEAQAIYQTLLQNAEDMIILSSFDGLRRYISPGVTKLTGWTPEEYMALDRMHTFHPDDREMANLVMESMASGKREHIFRYRMTHKDGGYRWVEAVARSYYDEKTGKVRGYVGTIRDISTLKQKEETWQMEREALTQESMAMAQLANTDALTVLPNRRAFDEAMQAQLNRSVAMAVLMIDIDFFKAYNDTYGHQAGDECLRTIAHTLDSQVSRGGDIVARLGGEEFGVLLPGVDVEGARRVAEAMLNEVWGRAIPHTGSPMGRVSVSIGIACWDDARGHDTALLIQQADRALYVSKRAGKNRATVAGAMPVAV